MSDTASVKAINDSISHWKRMIEWVKKQPPEKSPNSCNMRKALHETWYGESCALCELYAEDACIDCPLKKMTGMVCAENDSLWNCVIMSTTWGEWFEGANTLLLQLQEAKKTEGKT